MSRPAGTPSCQAPEGESRESLIERVLSNLPGAAGPCRDPPPGRPWTAAQTRVL